MFGALWTEEKGGKIEKILREITDEMSQFGSTHMHSHPHTLLEINEAKIKHRMKTKNPIL